MNPWVALLLALCAVALTVAIVVTLLALRRTIDRVSALLDSFEREVAPTAVEARGLTQEVRGLVRESHQELERLGGAIDRLNALADGLGRVVTGLAGLARAGQLVGVAVGLKRGIDVFVQRMRQNESADGGRTVRAERPKMEGERHGG